MLCDAFMDLNKTRWDQEKDSTRGVDGDLPDDTRSMQSMARG